MVIGVLAHDFIKTVLFETMLIAIMLILGGIVLVVVDRMPLQPRHDDAEGSRCQWHWRSASSSACR